MCRLYSGSFKLSFSSASFRSFSSSLPMYRLAREGPPLYPRPFLRFVDNYLHWTWNCFCGVYVLIIPAVTGRWWWILVVHRLVTWLPLPTLHGWRCLCKMKSRKLLQGSSIQLVENLRYSWWSRGIPGIRFNLGDKHFTVFYKGWDAFRRAVVVTDNGAACDVRFVIVGVRCVEKWDLSRMRLTRLLISVFDSPTSGGLGVGAKFRPFLSMESSGS